MKIANHDGRLALAGVDRACRGGDPVGETGGQQVTGVETDPHPQMAVETIDDLGKMLEAVSKVGALPGRAFEQHQRRIVRTLVQQRAERFGDQAEVAAHGRAARISRSSRAARRPCSLVLSHALSDGVGFGCRRR